MANRGDLKLIHHVNKYYTQSIIENHNCESGLDIAINYLLRTHREYQRKPQKILREAVADLLLQASRTPPSDTVTGEFTPPNGGSSPVPYYSTEASDDKADDMAIDSTDSSSLVAKKRRHGGAQGSDEESSTKKLETQMALAGGNMMNNSMRSKYAKQAKALPPPPLPIPPPSSIPSDTDANTNSSTNTSTNTPETTPKKKSKDPTKRQSSNLNSNPSSSSPFPSSSSGPAISALCERPTMRYADIGGVESILQTVRELIEYPLSHPEIYQHIGVEPPRGILLHGPPGCGKTLLANAMAGQLGVAFLKISAPEIVSGMSGESEQKVREIFQAAIDNAPAILFIDEVDAIMSKRDSNARGMEKRIVAQLLTCMDSLSMENTNNRPVMVIGATNRPDSIDSALRRAGRFDREICMGVPDQAARERILRVMTTKMRLDGEFDYLQIAKLTPGYVGADIRSLTKEAAVIAINRIFKDVLMLDHVAPTSASAAESALEVVKPSTDIITTSVAAAVPMTEEQMAPLHVCMADFLAAVKIVQPSSKREGFATVPDVSWKDIGALSDIREELTMSILEPISAPERFEQLGLAMPAGVLLYGPPGCGKTLLAKAIAHESGANFISVKGPELLDKYVGESERAVRQVFERARASSPCIVFFDELDSLCAKRGSDGGGAGVSDRVVNQLLTELDGLDSRKSVFVVAATNRPELIDPAMLRPGRLDKLLYVALPSPADRASILVALCSKAKLNKGIDVAALASSSRAEGYSGADLSALLREAGLSCLKEADKTVKGLVLQIEPRHFEMAFDHVMPSVSKEDQASYDAIRDRMSRARSRG